MDMTKRLPVFGAKRAWSTKRVPGDDPMTRAAMEYRSALAGEIGNGESGGGTSGAGKCRSMTKLQVTTLGPRDLPRGALAFGVAAQAARQIPAGPGCRSRGDPSRGGRTCQYAGDGGNILLHR